MSRKGKKIVFIVLDVLVLGFFGLYLSLNLKYKDNEVNQGDFAMKVLANDTTPRPITCTGNTYKNKDGGCSSCPTGTYANSDNTGCICPEVSATFSDACSGKTISSKGSLSTNCTAKVTNAGSGDTVEYSSSSSAASVSDGEVEAKSISGNPCKRPVTINAKVTNVCGNTKSFSTSVTVMVPWQGASGKECTMNPISQSDAESKNYMKYHSACVTDGNKCGSFTVTIDGKSSTKVGQYCDKITRGCGTNPPSPTPHCYDTGYGLLQWALNQRVVNNEIKDSTPSSWKIAKDANGNELTRDQCYTQFKCSTKYPGADTKESSCNSTNEFTGDYVKKCGILKGSSVGDEFYRIDCKETMKTGFNGPILNDSAHPNSFMYPGTAFKFNYLAKTKVECTGKWNQDFYNAAEAYVKNYIDAKKYNSFHQEDSGFFGSALAGVQNVRDSYKNWTLNYFNSSMSKETGEIKDIQPTVKNTSKDEKSFTLEMADGSTAVVSSCGSEPNGKNANFTYKVAYTIKMQMPVVYYSDSKKPQYTTTASTGYESIGRVFPISDIKEYANRKDYKYAVTVSNLGLGHKWVNKETCVLGVKEKEIVFRSINLSDPFIQYLDSNHQIGENWKNNKYDFTGIIDKNTWSNPSQFNKVTINQQIGALIKNELANQYASYLGSCAKGTDQGRTPQLCALYKQAVAGKK